MKNKLLHEALLRYRRAIYWNSIALMFFIITLLPVPLQAQNIVEQWGQLRVAGNRIVNEQGSPVQLRGMSLFWSQWEGKKYYNFETLKWLRDDWRCTAVRAAMGVEHGGYGANPELEKNRVIAVVDAAIELGLYVIIDFHVHQGQHYQQQAVAFFEEMAQRYGDKPNVIYEPWNEPDNTHSWSTQIKPYHEAVIAAIRRHDPDNIIVCGTSFWSQRVNEAALNPIGGDNIAYTLHFYAGTHGQELRNEAKLALDRGAALMVTEYGLSPASGDGPINEAESRLWWAFMDEHKLSYLNWSVVDKHESSAALKAGASGAGGWTANQLTPSGTLVREEIRTKNASLISTGLDDPRNAGSLTYPNPFESTFRIELEGRLSYQLFNQLGQLVESGNEQSKNQIGALLQPGLYLLHIQLGHKSENFKVVKL